MVVIVKTKLQRHILCSHQTPARRTTTRARQQPTRIIYIIITLKSISHRSRRSLKFNHALKNKSIYHGRCAGLPKVTIKPSANHPTPSHSRFHPSVFSSTTRNLPKPIHRWPSSPPCWEKNLANIRAKCVFLQHTEYFRQHSPKNMAETSNTQRWKYHCNGTRFIPEKAPDNHDPLDKKTLVNEPWQRDSVAQNFNFIIDKTAKRHLRKLSPAWQYDLPGDHAVSKQRQWRKSSFDQHFDSVGGGNR